MNFILKILIIFIPLKSGICYKSSGLHTSCSGCCCFLILTTIPRFNQNVQIRKYYLHHTYTWVRMSFSWALLLVIFWEGTGVGWQWFNQHTVLVFWHCKQKMHEFSTVVVWVQTYYFSGNPKSQTLVPVQYLSYAVPVPCSLLHMSL
jgi:hypothetical protein